MEYSVSETMEVANTEANTFQNLGFVVAALGEAVGIAEIKRSEDFIRPVVNSFSTVIEFRKVGSLGKIYPLCDQLSADGEIGACMSSIN